jgi:glycosyltransferase involved in cell wall biosynthesis
MSARPIVLMARALGAGGTERQVTETAVALDRRLFQPLVACFDTRGVRAEELRRAGVPIFEFPVRSFRTPRAAQVAWQFTRWLRARRIALLHPFDVPTVLFGVPLGRIAGVPVVLSSQRGDRELFPTVYQRALRVTDRLAHGIVVNSDYIRRQLVARDGVPDAFMHTCRNGLNASIFSPTGPVRRPDIAEDGRVVGIVAYLRPEKSIGTLVEAFAGLRDSRHRLVIVGDGPCREPLEARVRMMGLSNRCTFVPGTADLAAWYRGIDVFVLPTLNESLSNSLMEAMACGCCVIATNVGGNPELVRDGENGLLFEPGNAAELQNRLEMVLAAPDLRRALAHAARRTIEEGYTKELAARRMGELYQQQLNGRLREKP